MDTNARHSLLIAIGIAKPEAQALLSEGYSLDGADSVDQAAEMLRSGSYTAVLVDAGTMASLTDCEQMHRDLVERSNDGVVILQDTLVKFANPRFAEMSGYSIKKLLNSQFTDYMTHAEAAVLEERYRRRMAGEYVPSVYETSLTRKGGRKIPLEVSATIVRFHGRPADLVLVRDISDRKEAEDYLRRYWLLFETARDMIFFFARDRRILEANRAAVKEYGYLRSELLTMTADQLRAVEARKDLDELVKRAEKEAVLYETTHRRKDGSIFPVEISLSSAVVKDDQVLLAVVRDITERKRVQAELDAERSRLRSVLDAIPVAVMIADAQGGYAEANEQASFVWGGPIPRVSGLEEYYRFVGWRADTGEEILPENWAMARAITKGESTFAEVINILRFDNTCATILNSAAPVKDAEGNIIGGVVAEQDITEMVQLREALENALAQAEREGWRATILESIAEAGLAIQGLPELLEALAARTASALSTGQCCVFVLDDEKGEFEARAAYNVPGLLGCRVKLSESFVGRVAQERRAVYVADATSELAETETCDVDPHTRSMLAVPMIARDKVVGVMRAQSTDYRTFSPDESRLLQAIADRAAMAIDNAKLYEALQHSRMEIEEALEREKHFSLLLQEALLPASPRIGEGYSVAVKYVPAFVGREVGGDFYDVFGAGPDRAAILIGDVLGKGLEAASLAAITRSTIHAFVHESPCARDVLTRANSVIESQKPSPESFVTVCLVTLDLPTGDFAYCSAGHPPALLCRSDGTVEPLGGACLPLGVAEHLECEQAHDRLDPGDKLVLYTDGISEAHYGTALFDTEGIAHMLSNHAEWSGEEIVENLVEAATQWSNGNLTDDAVVVVVSRAA